MGLRPSWPPCCGSLGGVSPSPRQAHTASAPRARAARRGQCLPLAAERAALTSAAASVVPAAAAARHAVAASHAVAAACSAASADHTPVLAVTLASSCGTNASSSVAGDTAPRWSRGESLARDGIWPSPAVAAPSLEAEAALVGGGEGACISSAALCPMARFSSCSAAAAAPGGVHTSVRGLASAVAGNGEADADAEVAEAAACASGPVGPASHSPPGWPAPRAAEDAPWSAAAATAASALGGREPSNWQASLATAPAMLAAWEASTAARRSAAPAADLATTADASARPRALCAASLTRRMVRATDGKFARTCADPTLVSHHAPGTPASSSLSVVSSQSADSSSDAAAASRREGVPSPMLHSASADRVGGWAGRVCCCGRGCVAAAMLPTSGHNPASASSSGATRGPRAASSG
mmetsp:Transcript_842/g.3271  ORF Transcript_842/g.3271 Transcript_842/m.3271 type:complete len:413 (+) Transcript_842:317-1555(+)